MKFYTILILFVSHHIFAQYDTINFDDIIINKKYLLHTNTQGFPIKEEGKYQSFKWGDLVDRTIVIPFTEKNNDDEYGYEMKQDITYLYKEKEPDFIYISRISACKMYQIYFRFDGKLVNINRKRRDFFAKKFPKSYEKYIEKENQKEKYNGLCLKLKKDNDYTYLKIYLKKNDFIEQIVLYEKGSVE
ncbi:hypothetical protein [Capnocytophaga canis]|uniref:hypothetical protein n=1 Tax=Capnocytophaga canis TaxID=1848903 RepID=UPI0037D3171E